MTDATSLTSASSTSVLPGVPGDVGAGAHEGAGDDGGDNDVDKAIDKLFPATK